MKLRCKQHDQGADEYVCPSRTIVETPDGLRVDGVMEGSSARDLNRLLLTELRRVERRTRVRSAWTIGASTERFFDYVPKGRTH